MRTTASGPLTVAAVAAMAAVVVALAGNGHAAALERVGPRIKLTITVQPPGDSGVRLDFRATRPGEYVRLRLTIGTQTLDFEGQDEVADFVSVTYFANSWFSLSAQAWTDENPDLVSYESESLHTSVVQATFGDDDRTRIAVWRNGVWYILPDPDVPFSTPWGMDGDIPVPAQYGLSGSGRTDMAVWRPTDGVWWLKGTGEDYQVIPLGATGDVPVPGDYLGRGVATAAVWRPSTGAWMIHEWHTVHWGLPSDIPVPGDYDGDGVTDVAVWRPAGGEWWIKGSRAGEYVVAFGMRGDLPVPNDFDADGRTDLAVWREATGDWWIRGSTEGVRSARHGMRGDIPLLGDYDGDGRGDLAVARPGAAGLRWLIELSRGGSVDTVFGLATDRPVNGVWLAAPTTWKPPDGTLSAWWGRAGRPEGCRGCPGRTSPG